MRTMLKTLSEHIRACRPVVLVTVIASSGATPRGAGARMLVGEEGRISGTIGGGAVEYRSTEIAMEALKTGTSHEHDFSLTKDDVQNLGMICGGAVNVFFRFIPAGDEYSSCGSSSGSGKRVGSSSCTFSTAKVEMRFPFARKLFTPINSSTSISSGSKRKGYFR